MPNTNLRPLWTVETARLAGLKSVEARRKRKIANQEQIEAAKAMLQVASAVVVQSKAPADDYVQRRLARVRKQLDILDDLIAAEMAKPQPDAQRLDRYASAQARLATQEQQLSGRPLPGSRRPGKERQARGSAAAAAGADLEPVD